MVKKVEFSNVYVLVGGGLQYVGQTSRTMEQRAYDHQMDYKKYKEGGKQDYYMSSFEIFDKTSDFKYSILERVPFDERFKKEQEWIDRLECINRTKKKIRHQREYKKHTCECGQEIAFRHKKKHSTTARHKKLLEDRQQQA